MPLIANLNDTTGIIQRCNKKGIPQAMLRAKVLQACLHEDTVPRVASVCGTSAWTVNNVMKGHILYGVPGALIGTWIAHAGQEPNMNRSVQQVNNLLDQLDIDEKIEVIEPNQPGWYHGETINELYSDKDIELRFPGLINFAKRTIKTEKYAKAMSVSMLAKAFAAYVDQACALTCDELRVPDGVTWPTQPYFVNSAVSIGTRYLNEAKQADLLTARSGFARPLLVNIIARNAELRDQLVAKGLPKTNANIFVIFKALKQTFPNMYHNVIAEIVTDVIHTTITSKILYRIVNDAYKLLPSAKTEHVAAEQFIIGYHLWPTSVDIGNIDPVDHRPHFTNYDIRLINQLGAADLTPDELQRLNVITAVEAGAELDDADHWRAEYAERGLALAVLCTEARVEELLPHTTIARRALAKLDDPPEKTTAMIEALAADAFTDAERPMMTRALTLVHQLRDVGLNDEQITEALAMDSNVDPSLLADNELTHRLTELLTKTSSSTITTDDVKMNEATTNKESVTETNEPTESSDPMEPSDEEVQTIFDRLRDEALERERIRNELAKRTATQSQTTGQEAPNGDVLQAIIDRLTNVERILTEDRRQTSGAALLTTQLNGVTALEAINGVARLYGLTLEINDDRVVVKRDDR